jgi:hypothetical protein
MTLLAGVFSLGLCKGGYPPKYFENRPEKRQSQMAQLAARPLACCDCSSPDSHAGQTRCPGLEIIVVRSLARFISSLLS